MTDTAPLRRAPEQPPCAPEAEATCLSGMFTVPERMAHYDLGPHILMAPHRTLWRSMWRVRDGDPAGFFHRVFCDLAREQCPPECGPVHDNPACGTWRAIHVLDWLPLDIADDSDDGRLIFLLSLAKIERCTAARKRLSELQADVGREWRKPDSPYTPDEKARLLGLNDDSAIGMDIPS